MQARLSIGDFSRMTHLSVKALRHYHDVGLLEPVEIDHTSGYRYYEPDQVPVAQVIRRFRDLGMPLDRVKEVLDAPDLPSRNKAIMVHLEQMQADLARTQATVAGLEALLEGPPRLLPVEFFELDRAEVTAFVPLASAAGPIGAGSRVEPLRIPKGEFAVALHEGPLDDLDQTYAALGNVVAERAIGVDGPIREYYLVSFSDTDEQEQHRTEVCWPVFQTAP